MLALFLNVLAALRSALRTHAELALENLALRQQLASLHRSSPRSRLRLIDIVELPQVGGLHHRYERRAA